MCDAFGEMGRFVAVQCCIEDPCVEIGHFDTEERKDYRLNFPGAGAAKHCRRFFSDNFFNYLAIFV